jgi:hypothetical protein
MHYIFIMAEIVTCEATDATESPDVCWICLEDGNLIKPCSCPSFVHAECLHKWQVSCIGKDEEQECRFCHQPFPDWTVYLSKSQPELLSNNKTYFHVMYDGRSYRMCVEKDKYHEFENNIRRLLNIATNQQFDIQYHCKYPETDTSLIPNPKITVHADQNRKEELFNKVVMLASLSNKKYQDIAPLSQQNQQESFFECFKRRICCFFRQ